MKDTSSKALLQKLRLELMKYYSSLIVGPVALFMTIAGFSWDLSHYRELIDLKWWILRMGAFPISLLTIWGIRKAKSVMATDVFCLCFGAYMVLSIIVFARKAGGVKGPYLHAFLQVILASAAVPLSQLTFFIFCTGGIAAYFIFVPNDSHHVLRDFLHSPASITYNYVILAILIFYTLEFGRQAIVKARVAQIEEVENRQKEVDRLVQLKLDTDRAEALFDLAAQVSHDIRSPLSALEVGIKNFDQSDESRSLIRHAATRIGDIANSLLNERRNKTFHLNAPSLEQTTIDNVRTAPVLIYPLVESVVTEIRIQNRSRFELRIESKFSPHAIHAFVNANATELSRAIANLLTNATEAVDGKGDVNISVDFLHPMIAIRIIDTGKGIPHDLLAQLGTKGASFGKEKGTGLGLYQAKTAIERAGGKMEIKSQPSLGTEVMLALPVARSPNWFASSISIAEQSSIKILDDDVSIHALWLNRLKNEGIVATNISQFSSCAELETTISNSQGKNRTFYIIDFELSGQKSGLDFIEQFGIEKDSILVTSHYENDFVRQRAETLGVKILPKGFIGTIPIEVGK